MGKIKTHKASAKRFSVTANGKVKMFHSSHRHNTGNKSAKRLRHLRSSALVQGKMAENLNNREDAVLKEIQDIYETNVEK